MSSDIEPAKDPTSAGRDSESTDAARHRTGSPHEDLEPTCNVAQDMKNEDATEAEDGVESDNSSPGAADKKLDLYECNICLDTAQDAVVSLCGHLYWYEN